ncbi:HAD family hydrolase [Amycolatopsis rhizosphaerae]|uniref:HAD family hydrolase n=1 Tax=Amycolatopsis rhizosphaerae TaxID=2053003 RepID=UPI001FEB7773|nr:HAD-IB family hydrolase [Amycolatopsis rhizosphaerae]
MIEAERRISRRAAFFDVDETLISAKSMFAFLRYWCARNGDDGSGYRKKADELRRIAASGRPRAEGNRLYYRNFAGARAGDVLAAGREWYAAYRARPDAFVDAAQAALERHRAAGDLIVLVSGSFAACLSPLAEDVGADTVLCTEPVVSENGLYTGEVRVAMIGEAKKDAVLATIDGAGLEGASCFAYGDHVSDADMLNAVGNPVVVGGDPALGRIAADRGWPVLPSAGAPRRTGRCAAGMR